MEHYKNELLLLLGSIFGIGGLQELDLSLALFLKALSVITFGCYILMNHEKIVNGWKTFKKYFKK